MSRACAHLPERAARNASFPFTLVVYHPQNAKANGVTREEIAAIVTHAAFYVGWPKAWTTFGLAKDVWVEPWETNRERPSFPIPFYIPISPSGFYLAYPWKSHSIAAMQR